jgi:hypothetical protein
MKIKPEHFQVLSQECIHDIGAFITTLKVETPMDINGGCECNAKYEDDCECLAMTLTVSCNDDGTRWTYQTGDNSFSGACYMHPHWSVQQIVKGDDIAELLQSIVNDLNERLVD